MWRAWIGIGLLCATGRAGLDEFEKGQAKISWRFVRDIGKLVRFATREGAHGEAVALWRVILREKPDHSAARRALGYRKKKGTWVRTPKREQEVLERRDTDAVVGRRIARDRRRRERQRVHELVDLCEEHRADARVRPLLLRLLDVDPDSERLHLALGHEMINGVYVRTELLPIVRNMKAVRARWRKLSFHSPTISTTPEKIHLPSYKSLAKYRSDDLTIVSDYSDAETRRLATAAGVTALFIEKVLGAPDVVWQPTSVLLKPRGYNLVVRHYVKDRSKLRVALRYALYHAPYFSVWHVSTVEMGIDLHAHSVAFRSICEFAAPKLPATEPNGKPRPDYMANMWLCEGFGYLATLELFNTAITGTASPRATERKRRSEDAPDASTRSRGVVLRWVRRQVRSGNAYPLSQLAGMSINNLDELASLQAYSFLRFLCFVDEGAVGDFCRALSSQAKGSPAARLDRALRRAFGKGLVDLEPMWRRFVLEVEQR